MKKTMAILLITALLIGLLAGCSSDTTVKDYPVAVEGVTIDTKPDKLVSLSPMITSLVYELGGAARLAAISDFCGAAVPTVKDLPSVGSAQVPNIEAIISSGATVVLSVSAMSAGNQKKLTDSGIKLVILPVPTSAAELEFLYKNVGMVLSGTVSGADSGKNMYTNLTQKLQYLGGRLTADDKASYLLLTNLSGGVATGGTIENELLKHLHLTNAAEGESGYTVADDKLAAMNPDFLICPDTVTKEALLASRYKDLEAVKNDKVIFVDLHAFELCSTGMFDAVLAIGEKIYSPDKFTGGGVDEAASS